MGEDIMENADYLRVELHLAANTEMITKLEDFTRRRSKIDLVVPKDDIVDSPGLREVCEILFGDDAETDDAGDLQERALIRIDCFRNSRSSFSHRLLGEEHVVHHRTSLVGDVSDRHRLRRSARRFSVFLCKEEKVMPLRDTKKV